MTTKQQRPDERMAAAVLEVDERLCEAELQALTGPGALHDKFTVALNWAWRLLRAHTTLRKTATVIQDEGDAAYHRLQLENAALNQRITTLTAERDAAQQNLTRTTRIARSLSEAAEKAEGQRDWAQQQLAQLRVERDALAERVAELEANYLRDMERVARELAAAQAQNAVVRGAQARANAVVWAAAPDLLAACEAVQAYWSHASACDECGDGMICDTGMPLSEKAGDLLEAVIRKVKGEQA